MKANEAPEKIYVHHSKHIKRLCASTAQGLNDVEYTRTDAFIEKVLDFFENDLCCYIVAQDFTIEHERLENDFENYMKGE